MVYLKACPRCRGDLMEDEDGRVHYLCCLQCGHILSGVEETALQFAVARQDRLTSAASGHQAAEAGKLRPVGEGDGSMAIAS